MFLHIERFQSTLQIHKSTHSQNSHQLAEGMTAAVKRLKDIPNPFRGASLEVLNMHAPHTDSEQGERI